MAATRSSRYGTWLVLGVLAVFLVFALAFLYVGWGMADSELDRGLQMSGAGYVAMTFGIIVTLALGIGLMALIFSSNRRGHDRVANIAPSSASLPLRRAWRASASNVRTRRQRASPT
jgi:TRAP-type C4-dicarboxylate transport system permease small subunit